jgi:PPK2 family polyphosphate:nucleotide phosphotransferase
MKNPHRLVAGKPVKLSECSTRAKDFHADRELAEAEFFALREELIDWQRRLYAESERSLLVVLQAMDAGGKDGTIRHVLKGVNPQGVRVASFKAPSTLERSHDFLWRIHSEVPARGMIRVFNRSHYEDVLIVRVKSLVPKEVWSQRYDRINEFEKQLTDSGTTIIKFFLHISREEQHERFRARLTQKEKLWKFSPQDVEESKHWDDYQAAYEDALNKCHTEHAPWFVIPSDQKWYRNLAVCQTIVETLREMKPDYPKVTWNPDDYHLEHGK